jgi:predicted transcriptional regulator
MPSVLVDFDEPTLRALSRIAPTAKRQRAEFIRKAVKEAIRREEYARIRAAYRKQPDSSGEADAWSNCEKFEP